MNRPTRDQMERAYISALVAGSDRTNECKQLRIESNDGEPISLDEFCDLMAQACLERASEGRSSGWLEIVHSKSSAAPTGFCSSGVIGITCPGDTELFINAEIDASVLLENMVYSGQILVLFAASLEAVLGIEVNARVTRTRYTLLVTWIPWERKCKITTMLSMPRGYEAYCAGVPLDDIVT